MPLGEPLTATSKTKLFAEKKRGKKKKKYTLYISSFSLIATSNKRHKWVSLYNLIFLYQKAQNMKVISNVDMRFP